MFFVPVPKGSFNTDLLLTKAALERVIWFLN